MVTVSKCSVLVKYDLPPTIETFVDRWGERHEIVREKVAVNIAPGTQVEALTL